MGNRKPTSISSREFNQDVGRAKRAASEGPVFITDRGRPAHVLLSIEEYERLLSSTPSIAALLGMDEDLDFEPPQVTGLFHAPDLTD